MEDDFEVVNISSALEDIKLNKEKQFLLKKENENKKGKNEIKIINNGETDVGKEWRKDCERLGMDAQQMGDMFNNSLLKLKAEEHEWSGGKYEYNSKLDHKVMSTLELNTPTYNLSYDKRLKLLKKNKKQNKKK